MSSLTNRHIASRMRFCRWRMRASRCCGVKPFSRALGSESSPIISRKTRRKRSSHPGGKVTTSSPFLFPGRVRMGCALIILRVAIRQPRDLSTKNSARTRPDCHSEARGVLVLRVMRILLVGLGGMVGSIARFWLSAAVQGAAGGTPFPYGTLAVNIIGSFILGIVITLQMEREIVSPEIRVLL